MSAAGPLPPPPPGRPPGTAMNGHPHGSNGSGDSWAVNNTVGGNRGSGGPSPSVAEISAAAGEKVNELKHQPIARLVELARQHFHNAKLRSNGREGFPATYWEYLMAYELVVEAVPGHRDYYDKINNSRGQLSRDYKDLVREVRSNEERFVRIREIIANENKRNGLRGSQTSSRPSSGASQYTTASVESELNSRRFSSSAIPKRDDELMMPNVPLHAPSGRAPPSSQADAPRKPQVHPKPQSLHGRALHQSSASISGPIDTNDLAARFASLRGTAAPINTSPAPSGHNASVKMPSPTDYHSNRPLGPRDMPPPPLSSSRAPTHPPKLPLDTKLAASMPKEPSPTYSPARNLSLPAHIPAPRSTARSMVGTGGRSNSLAASSSASAYAPGSNGDSDSYFPTQPMNVPPAPARRTSVNKPMELQITAEKLYDYIRMYNVLLIDVRNREEFDSGHIFVRSVICIEPTALRDDFSAEQLQDSLIISPDEELAMFERRNEYDLVVYYDESTKTHAFLNKYNPNERELALKRVYTTLHEFNAEKPLQRPPIFLMGGIDAWTDLVGTQSLKMSTTAGQVASGRNQVARPIRRAAAASQAAKLNLHRRRMREYAPMDEDEERQWLEEARRGRVVFDQQDEDYEDDEPASPVYRTTEEFLRHFPEIDAQQSMVYPSRPPPSVPMNAPAPYVAPPIPQAPSRPAPSVPRVSYSGVHERQVAPQGRANQLPVYVSPGRHGQMRLHRTGLINFGVTCYMNSVVQCLAANAELSGIFLSPRYLQDIQRDNWKGTKGILPEAYATLISNLYKGDVNNLRPTSFRRICGHFNSQWGVDEQQDAKEFLEFVLDHLHEDLNLKWNRSPLKQLSEAEEMRRESFPRPYVAIVEWSRYTHREMSVIGRMFAGQHASQLTCTTCGITSTTYEAFWSISVEIPRNRPADLRDCLRSYCSPERLSGDEVWRCPRCKKDREAMKKITITRAPDSLVVHFKRFSASHTERAHKVRSEINFPLQGLDLAPFMEPSITPEDEKRLMTIPDGASYLASLKQDPAMNGPFQYNAYAVIHHIGNSLGSGHYIAHVKDKSRGCWRRFNDTNVNDFEPANLQGMDRLQSERAYIVFYERERVA
ncbi:cysteine proteinase [Aaosphaeria arxii CBS 175.79]|uniref:Cysteine proteinase n=1 Tax=Aaosphaeria arxii CBS 175.79 TaxID=1450172 RepID=A0A6A5X9B9_9PLEO|nr:cysteine proteinase [Aaosphaeria arxii CBS 175.79]KAF2009568.1 cysteine proteinase [Aaosphaeria arxii CBS 175.79]